MTNCILCGREKMFEGEGRIIDGSWANDRNIPEEKWGWVCCYKCYEKILKKTKNIKHK